MIDFTSLEKMGKKQNNYIMYYTHKKNRVKKHTDADHAADRTGRTLGVTEKDRRVSGQFFKCLERPRLKKKEKNYSKLKSNFMAFKSNLDAY